MKIVLEMMDVGTLFVKRMDISKRNVNKRYNSNLREDSIEIKEVLNCIIQSIINHIFIQYSEEEEV
jgi:hypothetical protein